MSVDTQGIRERAASRAAQLRERGGCDPLLSKDIPALCDALDEATAWIRQRDEWEANHLRLQLDDLYDEFGKWGIDAVSSLAEALRCARAALEGRPA